MLLFFFFNDTATTEIYTLSLHDALPIWGRVLREMVHNGIEYADIQLIAEAYDLLTHVAGLDAPTIGKIFEEWNSGDLESFLIEITGRRRPLILSRHASMCTIGGVVATESALALHPDRLLPVE